MEKKRVEFSCPCFKSFSNKNHIVLILGENVKIYQELSNADIQSRFIAKFDVMPQFVDTPNHTVQGFIVNRKCKHVETVFLQPDHGVIFKNNNFWLFIDNDASLELNESIVGIRVHFQSSFNQKIINQRIFLGSIQNGAQFI